MARATNKLTDRTVKAMTKPGRYADGGGLELQVSPSGGRSWAFRFMLAGKRRQMGLGAYPDTSLADARKKAAEARRLLDDGVDPLSARDASRAAAIAADEARKAADAKRKTFRQCAETYIDDKAAGWKNPKLEKLWRSTLRTYAYPVFGDWPVSDVDTGAVMDVIRPLWIPADGKPAKLETASRVRMRIESVLDWARANGYRSGENPARLRGHLDHLLPKRSKVAKVQHHKALPFVEMKGFMADLRRRDALAARGLELLILTATRTSEVLGARWSEFDLDGAVWVIPEGRMKMDEEHRVPLSKQAVEMLRKLYDGRTSDVWVFPGGRVGKPLSNMAFLVLLERMGLRGKITPHGFRSSFRDWAAEETDHPNHVCEAALAHGIENAVEEAYRRGDLFDKRVPLMQEWADYCGA